MISRVFLLALFLTSFELLASPRPPISTDEYDFCEVIELVKKHFLFPMTEEEYSQKMKVAIGKAVKEMGEAEPLLPQIEDLSCSKIFQEISHFSKTNHHNVTHLQNQVLVHFVNSLDPYSSYAWAEKLKTESENDVQEKNIYEIIDGDIGYIKLGSFEKGTAMRLIEKMKSWQDLKFKGIILDLRDNPGGLLDEAYEFLDALTSEKVLFKIIFRHKTEVVFGQPDQAILLPLVALINERTASASELVAALLSETKRALLMGSPTYGKKYIQMEWSPQCLTHIWNDYNRYLKITMAFFELPEKPFLKLNPELMLPSSKTYSSFLIEKAKAQLK